MNIDLAALPADIDTLHRMIGELTTALDSERTEAQAEIDRLRQIVKILYWDGTGLCLFSKRLEEGRFAWPSVDEAGDTVSLTSAQLSMLIEGIDWRAPERRWRPAVAG